MSTAPKETPYLTDVYKYYEEDLPTNLGERDPTPPPMSRKDVMKMSKKVRGFVYYSFLAVWSFFLLSLIQYRAWVVSVATHHGPQCNVPVPVIVSDCSSFTFCSRYVCNIRPAELQVVLGRTADTWFACHVKLVTTCLACQC